MYGHNDESMTDPKEVSPLAMSAKCVNNTLTSFVPDSDLGLEEVPVLSVGLEDEEEDQESSFWEESCFLVFSKFLGFLVKGYKGRLCP